LGNKSKRFVPILRGEFSGELHSVPGRFVRGLDFNGEINSSAAAGPWLSDAPVARPMELFDSDLRHARAMVRVERLDWRISAIPAVRAR